MKHFFSLKMAISVNQNGHFEEWLQIFGIVGKIWVKSPCVISFSSKLNMYQLLYIFEERKGSTGSQKKQEDQTIQQWIGQTNYYVYWKKIKINTY